MHAPGEQRGLLDRLVDGGLALAVGKARLVEPEISGIEREQHEIDLAGAQPGALVEHGLRDLPIWHGLKRDEQAMAQAGRDQRVGDIVERVRADEREAHAREIAATRNLVHVPRHDPAELAELAEVHGARGEPVQRRLIGRGLAKGPDLPAEIFSCWHQPRQMHGPVPDSLWRRSSGCLRDDRVDELTDIPEALDLADREADPEGPFHRNDETHVAEAVPSSMSSAVRSSEYSISSSSKASSIRPTRRPITSSRSKIRLPAG